MPRQMGGVNSTTYLYQRGACGCAGGVDWVQTGVTIGIGEGRPVMRAFCDCDWWTNWRAGDIARGWALEHSQTGSRNIPQPTPVNPHDHGGLLAEIRADLDHHRHCPDSCRSKADFAEGRRKSWWR